MTPAEPPPAARRIRGNRSGGSNPRWSTHPNAPNQGYQGAPDAWLVVTSEVREGIRDLQVGSDVFVLTWLHRARRDELATQPGDDRPAPSAACSAPARR